MKQNDCEQKSRTGVVGLEFLVRRISQSFCEGRRLARVRFFCSIGFFARPGGNLLIGISRNSVNHRNIFALFAAKIFACLFTGRKQVRVH
jgi:hypothetical protein